jgi:hypothetical protein
MDQFGISSIDSHKSIIYLIKGQILHLIPTNLMQHEFHILRT